MIPDPTFDDPTAWSITTTQGTAAVTGGALVCTGWRGSVTCAAPLPEIGTVYAYRAEISAFSGAGLAVIQYGGTIPPIWTGAQGTGTFTGRFTATDDSFGVNIAVAFTASDLTVDYLEIVPLHLREQIRSAIVTAVTGLTTTSTRVYTSPAGPLAAGSSPSLLVLTGVDTPAYDPGSRMGGPPAVERTLEVHVQGYASAADTLDDIAEEVETALYVDPTLGGLATGTRLGAQTIEFDTDGERVEAAVDMVFLVTYRAAEGAPGTAV